MCLGKVQGNEWFGLYSGQTIYYIASHPCRHVTMSIKNEKKVEGIRKTLKVGSKRR